MMCPSQCSDFAYTCAVLEGARVASRKKEYFFFRQPVLCYLQSLYAWGKEYIRCVGKKGRGREDYPRSVEKNGRKVSPARWVLVKTRGKSRCPFALFSKNTLHTANPL